MGRVKIPPVTDEFWETKVPKKMRRIADAFLRQQRLSESTRKQYRSNLRIFMKWIHDELGEDVVVTDLKPRHALEYQDWLIERGLANKSINSKRSTVSAFCEFIILYYDDEYPNFNNIYSRGVPSVGNEKKKEKEPLTSAEMQKLIKTLEEREEWQKLAYLYFTFITGCRREESRQLLGEVAYYDKIVDSKGQVRDLYATHEIRTKGAGKQGKVRRFKFNEVTMHYLRQWMEHRKKEDPDDECPYMFVSKRNGKYQQVAQNTFNYWCKGFGEILGNGRHVHPHLIRSSRATIAVVEEGVDIRKVQRLLGHESSQTTEIYVVRDEEDDLEGLL